ncbi:MAG TPA: tetratricopeptide repeat protein [Caulobacteraceae bacterium]|nr:tetratricopeptide repeat protein [Caulobacteraceae bacterium]
MAEDASVLVARADALAAAGRFDDAKAAYLAALALKPDHLQALNNFGALVHAHGFRSAARTLYAEAARHHPHDPLAQVNLANSLMETGETEAARLAFEAALRARPDFAPGHRGLARLASAAGDHTSAERHLQAGFAAQPVITQPFFGAKSPIEVLLLISGVDGDIPLGPVLDPGVFKVTALAPQFFAPDQPLPPHHVVFNAIGDADLCAKALEGAERLVRRTDRPVINAPGRVLATGRTANARRLAGLEGVIAPANVLLGRDEAAAVDSAAALEALGLCLPVAVRAPGYHTGQHFERVDAIEDLSPALARLPGEQAMVMLFFDTRGPDGAYRKYRAMMIDGRLYPLHLAVSSAWKVHYFTADMARSPQHRAEDAAFLADMPGVIGPRAMAALQRVRAALGLDYGGVDFALSADGDLVLFEANATMALLPPPDDPMWDYRRAPVQAALDAVKAMIVERART